MGILRLLKAKRKSGLRVRWSRIIKIRIHRGVPRLLVPSAFEPLFKWFLRGLTAVGILTSVLSFPWYVGLGVAILLVLTEQFLERTVFQTAAIYIQPMPPFKVDENEWTAMGFAFPEDRFDPTLLNVVGPAFRSKEYATRFFGLLRDWNLGQSHDTENNIRLSFVTEKDGRHYTCYLYPSVIRKPVREFFENVPIEDEERLARFIVQMKLCKTFALYQGSQLDKFFELQKKDRPFWLQPFLLKEGGEVELLYEVDPILKLHYAIKHRADLTPSDAEYRW